jgi:hypothetical protein
MTTTGETTCETCEAGLRDLELGMLDRIDEMVARRLEARDAELRHFFSVAYGCLSTIADLAREIGDHNDRR